MSHSVPRQRSPRPCKDFLGLTEVATPWPDNEKSTFDRFWRTSSISHTCDLDSNNLYFAVVNQNSLSSMLYCPQLVQLAFRVYLHFIKCVCMRVILKGFGKICDRLRDVWSKDVSVIQKCIICCCWCWIVTNIWRLIMFGCVHFILVTKTKAYQHLWFAWILVPKVWVNTFFCNSLIWDNAGHGLGMTAEKPLCGQPGSRQSQQGQFPTQIAIRRNTIRSFGKFSRMGI